MDPGEERDTERRREEPANGSRHHRCGGSLGERTDPPREPDCGHQEDRHHEPGQSEPGESRH
jgi:hypothetical protein